MPHALGDGPEDIDGADNAKGGYELSMIEGFALRCTSFSMVPLSASLVPLFPMPFLSTLSAERMGLARLTNSAVCG